MEKIGMENYYVYIIYVYIYSGCMIGKDDDSLGALIHDVAHALRKLIDRRVEPYNLTRSKWLALGVLDRHDGLTLSELADAIEIGNASVGRLVDRLEARGFVTRKADPVDRRAVRIYIKDSARPKLQELENISAGIREKALGVINKEDRNKLINILQSIKDNIGEGLPSLYMFYVLM